MSWDGYQDVPGHVIEGYATIFEEVDVEIARRAVPGPDVVVVQMGVGALAGAGIVSGESGAAGYAGPGELLRGRGRRASAVRRRYGR